MDKKRGIIRKDFGSHQELPEEASADLPIRAHINIGIRRK